MWRFIFSLCILASSLASAQTTEEQVLEALNLDTLAKFRIRSLELNFNMMRFGENLLDKPRTSNEFQGELNIHKFNIVADIGSEKTKRGGYEMHGTYWRVGLDVNLSAAWEEGNMIGLGLRYAKSKFTDQASIIKDITDGEGNVLSTQNIFLDNENLSARWAELVFKMRGSIYKNLYMGYTMRYQFFKLITPHPEQLRPFDIPGYGKTRRPNSFQFDYYVGWRISFD